MPARAMIFCKRSSMYSFFTFEKCVWGGSDWGCGAISPCKTGNGRPTKRKKTAKPRKYRAFIRRRRLPLMLRWACQGSSLLVQDYCGDVRRRRLMGTVLLRDLL